MIFLFEDHPLLKERIASSFRLPFLAEAFIGREEGILVRDGKIAWYESKNIGYPHFVFSKKRVDVIIAYLKEFYPEALI